MDKDAKVHKNNRLKESLARLMKEEITFELLLNMVNLSKAGLYLASLVLTNFADEVLSEVLILDGRFWELYVKQGKEQPVDP